MEDNMLPQGVVDGIIKYVNSAMRTHIRVKNDEGKYTKMDPQVVNTPDMFMLVFQFTNRPFVEVDASEEE
jgi:hypothetical protein